MISEAFSYNAFNYKAWADKRTLAAIESIDSSQEKEAYDFCCQQINHMVIVEELFKSRLLGEAAPHSCTNTDVLPALATLKQRLESSTAWYQNFAANLEIDKEKIQFVFADGKNGRLSIAEILFHIITHGSYHRGNIAHALDKAGVPHPIDGYGIYIHQQEPDRRN